MQWRNPSLLWLLPAVATLAVVTAIRLRRRGAAMSAFAEEALLTRLTPALDLRRRHWRLGLRSIAVMLLVTALAGPKWGFRWEEVRREGIDLIVAIDTSRSMLATDVKPNRLERAKLAVLDLVKLLKGDRIGLVAFAGTAFLECPLTLDYAAFERSLRALQVGIIPRGGTALSRAIDTGLEGFEAREGKHEALILITDGENHEGDPEEAAQRSKERGVAIYTVGIGTTEGELIPVNDEGVRNFVKDRKGQVVKSRLDEATLEKIASETGGAYVRGLGAGLGLDEVFRDHIAKMERRELAGTLTRRYEDRFQLPLGLALLLLVIESLIGERKGKRTGGRRRVLTACWRGSGRGRVAGFAQPGSLVAVLLLVFLSPALLAWFDPVRDRAAEGNHLYAQKKYTQAAEKYGEGLVESPESLLLQFNLADALYRQGKYAEAATKLTKVLASGDPRWIGRAAQNLGNARYRLGAAAEEKDPQAALASYAMALTAYKRAMAADPRDPDPKFNHEFVSRKMAALRKRIEKERQEQEEKKQQQQQEEEADDKQPQEKQTPQEKDESEAQQEPTPQAGGENEQQQPGSDQQQQNEQEATPGPQEAAGDQDGEEPQAPESKQQETAQSGSPEGSGGEGEEPPPTDEQRAARAVLDTARDEELDPQEMQRAVGAARLGAPTEDW